MTEPDWLSGARRDDGLAEIPGAASHPRILAMAHAIGAPAWFHDDDQPWCAVAMNAWLRESGHPIATGERGDYFDRLRALTFMTYGQELRVPALGAIGVFSRPEGAHVGMYLGEWRDLYYIYGGNQTNRVCATWIQKDRKKSWRWPPDVALPTPMTIVVAHDGTPLSSNEA